MKWVLAFGGVGATSGPLVIASCLSGAEGWRWGYVIIAVVQLSLVGLFAATLGWWSGAPKSPKVVDDEVGRSGGELRWGPNSEAGILSAGIFAIYVGVEITVGLWIATHLVELRGASLAVAGFVATGYFGSITLGRILVGLVAGRWGNRRVMGGGAMLAVVGAVLFLVADSVSGASLGVILMGWGFAPIYPGHMYEAPNRFAPEAVQTVIGRQTASSYIGGAALPAISGWLVQEWSVSSVPWIALGGTVLLGLVIWRVNRLTARK